MKKIVYLLFFVLVAQCSFAQSAPSHPVMTPAFTDSLKNSIGKILPADYKISLSYVSAVSTEGKLLKPLILRETANGTVEDNEFVQKMRVLIINAPVWKPATDASGQPVESKATFDVIINDNKITITDTSK